jgi:glycerate-2-kinase
VQNVEVSEKIVELSKKLTDKDLVIVIVSGGGSALLCWPMKECEQAQRLYQDFLKTGGDIKELNTIRKHISMLKGGGLAKELYPATVVGLIFSDVPGDHYELIASGPTYKDISTMGDAQAILDKYNLSGYELNETPTDDKYFERVTNIPLVSNLDALDAMRQEAERLRIKSKVLSAELYDSPQQVVQQFMKAVEPGCILVGGGEPEVIVTKTGGRGGRSQKLGLEMLTYLTDKDVFAAVASDGLDNSPLAGVIEDQGTLEKAKAENVNLEDHIESWDSQGFYEKTGHELLQTGPTEANVSDLMIFYRKD